MRRLVLLMLLAVLALGAMAPSTALAGKAPPADFSGHVQCVWFSSDHSVTLTVGWDAAEADPAVIHVLVWSSVFDLKPKAADRKANQYVWDSSPTGWSTVPEVYVANVSRKGTVLTSTSFYCLTAL